jgi:pre-mRNA-splicing factor SYF1
MVNYAQFLEDNMYFEESFKVLSVGSRFILLSQHFMQVYERGVELFTFPVAFELWNIYLSKFVKRYVSLVVFISLYPPF